MYKTSSSPPRHVGCSVCVQMRRGSTLVGLAALALAACSTNDASFVTRAERTSSISESIVNGTASPKAQDYVVQIAIQRKGKTIPFCTGTLVAKNLVITARHCTGELSSDEMSLNKEYSPSELKFYFGTGAGPKTIDQPPEAQGARFFTNKKMDLVPDIAVVLLDKEVDQPIAPIRLTSGAVKGELLDIVGYGLTEADLYPRTRQQRKGVKVARKGPGTSRLFDLLAGEFQFGEAACAGDSGGPALSSETGALVGVASRVANGEDTTDAGAAAFCLGSTAEDVYTDLTPAKAFIDEAFEAIGATPWLEGEEQPAQTATQKLDEKAQPTMAASDGCSAIGGSGRHSSPALVFLALGVVVALGRRRRLASRA